jgi:hypothetical protein
MAKTPSCVDLLTEVFGREKVSNFPDALLETMQTFYETTFHKVVAISQGYCQTELGAKLAAAKATGMDFA